MNKGYIKKVKKKNKCLFHNASLKKGYLSGVLKEELSMRGIEVLFVEMFTIGEKREHTDNTEM